MTARKSIVIILALLLVVAFSGISYAQQAQPAKPAKPAEKKEAAPAKAAAKDKSVTAAVKAVNAEGKTVTLERKVKGKVQELVISIAPDTKIMKGKETLALTAVKAADRLRVKYVEGEGGKLIAKSIEVREAKAAKKK